MQVKLDSPLSKLINENVFCCICGKFDHLDNSMCYNCTELKKCFNMSIVPKTCSGCDPKEVKCNYCCIMKMAQLKIISWASNKSCDIDVPPQSVTADTNQTATNEDLSLHDPRKKARKRYQTECASLQNGQENATSLESMFQQPMTRFSSSSLDLSQPSSSNSNYSSTPISPVFPSIANLQPLSYTYTQVKSAQFTWAQKMMTSFALIPHYRKNKLIDFALPQLSLLELLCKKKISIVDLFTRNMVLLTQYTDSLDLQRDFEVIQTIETLCKNKFLLQNELGYLGAMLLLQPEAIGIGARNDVNVIITESNNLRNQLIQYLLVALGNEVSQSLIHLVGIMDLFRVITRIQPQNLDYILKTILS